MVCDTALCAHRGNQSCILADTLPHLLEGFTTEPCTSQRNAIMTVNSSPSATLDQALADTVTNNELEVLSRARTPCATLT